MLICTVLCGALLKITAAVSVPVTVAILLSCVFLPIVKNLHTKLKIPWILGTLAVALLFIVALTLISTIIVTSVTTFLEQYPKYESKFMTIYKIFAENLNFQVYDDKSFFENIWSMLKVREFAQNAAIATSGKFITFAKNIGIILMLLVFLLIEMRGGRRKIDSAFQGKIQGRVVTITRKVTDEVIRFVFIKFFVSLATGLVVHLCARVIGLDFAIMWGFVAFVMNFIPTFGSVFSVGMTTLFALLQFYPRPFPVIFIFASTTLANMILGVIVEPRVEGKNLGISPFVILASLLLWGWLWGFIGMILAVPLTVIVKIICENVSFLHTIAVLLGNKPADALRALSGAGAENPEGVSDE